MTARAVEQPHESTFRKWGNLMVLSLALAIIIIDSTLLNVSLSTLVRELHTNLQSLQWVISAYSLMLAALTVTGGRMGDLFGRKWMFKLGAIIFAVGSFIASISRSVPVLLLGESIIEGIGAALMMPATASLLVSKYRGHDRAIAFGIWGGVAAAASAIGPILGGFLTTHFSWRWGFRINVFVVALLLIGSVIVEDSGEREGKRIDWIGVLLSAIGLFFIVFGIIESSTYGWIRARKPFPLWQPDDLSIALPSVVFGAVVLATLSTDVKLTALIPGLALYGIGMGLVLSQINNLTLSAVPVREAGEASGVSNTFRQIGASLGAAIIGAILLSTILVQLESAVESSARIPPQAKSSITSTLRAQASGLAFGSGEIFAQLPPEVQGEMLDMRRAATTAGIRRAFLYGAIFAILGLLVSTRLPLRPREHA